MAQQLIINGEGGLDARNAINGNFTELYGALTFPIKLGALSANAEQQILANTVVTTIWFNPTAGAPSVSIGTTGGGQQILPVTAIGAVTPISLLELFADTTTLFFTITGGTVEITILIVPNLF